MVTIIAIDSTAERFDILDAFSRVFWRDMDADTAIRAANELDCGAGLYRIVEHTGLPHGAKVVGA